MTKIRWKCQRFLNGPAKLQAVYYGVVMQPCNSCPFGQPECSALKGDSVVLARVFGLVAFRFPHAIFLAVRAVIIKAFNRVIWSRSWFHVPVESFKRVVPFIGHQDASCAIVLECFARRQVAAALDSRPDPEFSTMRHAVCRQHFCCVYASEASAGFG